MLNTLVWSLLGGSVSLVLLGMWVNREKREKMGIKTFLGDLDQ